MSLSHHQMPCCYLVTTPSHAQDLQRQGRGRAEQRTTRSRPHGSRAAGGGGGGGGGQLTPLTPRGGPERRSRGRSTLLAADAQQQQQQGEEGWGEEEEEEEEEEGRRPTRRGSRGCRAVPRHARPYLEEPEPEEEEEEGEPEGRRPRRGSRGRYAVPRHSRPYLEGEQAVELVEPTAQPTAHSVQTVYSPQQLVEPTMRRVRVEPVPVPPSRMGVPPAYYGTDDGGPRGDISFRI